MTDQYAFGIATLRLDLQTLIQTTDGGFLIGGGALSGVNPATADVEPVLVKLNADGSLAWSVTYATLQSSTILEVVEMATGDFTAVGTIVYDENAEPTPSGGFRLVVDDADGGLIGSEEIRPNDLCVTPSTGGDCIPYVPRTGLRGAVFNPLTQTVVATGFVASPFAPGEDTHDIVLVTFDEGASKQFASARTIQTPGKTSGSCRLSIPFNVSPAFSDITSEMADAFAEETEPYDIPLNLGTSTTGFAVHQCFWM